VAVQKKESALFGAVVGTMTMENNPRFNAGTGANIRLDGKTIQMDAAVMTSDGEFAAIAAVERVRNPVRVAQALLATPHRMLAGEGATRFAHQAGFADVVPICPEAEVKFQRRIQKLLQGEAGGGYDTFDWRHYWNYPDPPPSLADLSRLVHPDSSDVQLGDTVGTVTRDGAGNFAASLSTGGTSLTLYGRVGDVPIFGCGLFAGPSGAVACTGFGEEIIRHAMARAVYEIMAAGFSAQVAVQRGCELFGPEFSLGLIAVGNDGWGVAANREMAFGQASSRESVLP
jgi:isoaspartyl peptidase/L-asparaginase-like protein (Ntn-hydrolase superfamily)